ncbi:endospore germination permease [Peptococcaceae bacterium 1198_IL3148]
MVQISNFQLMVMVFSTMLANGLNVLPRLAAGLAGPGGWIIVLLQGLGSILAVIALVKVCRQFPDASFVNLNKRVFGGVIGTLVGLIIGIDFIFEAGNVARGVVNIAITSVYSQTPIVVLMALVMAVAVYAVYQGIEVLARTNTVLFVLKLMAIIILTLLTIPALASDNLLPLWDRGSLPWAEGLVNIQSAYSGFIILAFLYPYLNSHRGTGKMASLALLLVTIAYVEMTVVTIALFNSCEVSREIWPTISFIRAAPFPMDAPFMLVWVTNAFSVIAGCLYIASEALKEVLKLKDYRSILLPSAVIAMTIGVWPRNLVEVGELSTNIAYVGVFIHIVLPFVLLAVITITKKQQPKP